MNVSSGPDSNMRRRQADSTGSLEPDSQAPLAPGFSPMLHLLADDVNYRGTGAQRAANLRDANLTRTLAPSSDCDNTSRQPAKNLRALPEGSR